MENFQNGKFARRQYKEKNDKETRSESKWCSSLIRFHGVIILPPLLAEPQREEMLMYKEEAMQLQKSKQPLGQRMSKIQSLLDSVQPRKAKTLGEFILDDSNTTVKQSANTVSWFQTSKVEGIVVRRWDPPQPFYPSDKPKHKGKVEDLSCDRPTYTACVACSTKHFSDPYSTMEAGQLTDHSSESSAYQRMTSSQTPDSHGNTSHQSMSSGYVTNDNIEVTCHTSGTVELGPLSSDGGQAARIKLFSQEATHRSTRLPVFTDDHTNAALGESLQASQPRVRPGEQGRPEEGNDSDLNEVPYRMSLQDLLKKSQDYRRQLQQQLRAARLRAGREVEDLSDNNNEFPGTGQAEMGKIKEKTASQGRVQFFLETSHVDQTLPSPLRTQLTGKAKCSENLEDREKVFDCSEDKGQAELSNITTHSKLIDDHSGFIHSSSSLTQSFHLFKENKSDSGLLRLCSVDKKFGTIPRPQICASPTRCVRRSGSLRKILENTALDVGNKVRTGWHYDPTEGTVRQVAKIESTLDETPVDDEASEEASLEGVPAANIPGDMVACMAPVQREPRCSITPVAQKLLVPEALCSTTGLGLGSSKVFSDVSDRPVKGERISQGLLLTPERAGHRLESQAKRKVQEVQAVVDKLHSSTPKVWLASLEKQLHLKQVHTKQIQALMEEQQKQKEQLLQKISRQYQLLRHVAFQQPMSSSHLEDTATSLASVSPALRYNSGPQPLCSISQSHRLLVAAAVQGYLTRRLLRTERVTQLLRTVKDSQQFLLAFQQPQNPGRAAVSSRQDHVLKEQVLRQLRSARYEVHDIFFSYSTVERMQIIFWDRKFTQVRELKCKENSKSQTKARNGSLSAATRKRSLIDCKRGQQRYW